MEKTNILIFVIYICNIYVNTVYLIDRNKPPSKPLVIIALGQLSIIIMCNTIMTIYGIYLTYRIYSLYKMVELNQVS